MLRQFGAILALVAIGSGITQFLRHGRPVLGGTLLGIGLVAALLSLWRPTALRIVFTTAMVCAFPIGFVVSQILLALMFWLVFLPIGICLKLAGRDPLALKRPTTNRSFWEPKTTPTDLRRYLRQY